MVQFLFLSKKNYFSKFQNLSGGFEPQLITLPYLHSPVVFTKITDVLNLPLLPLLKWSLSGLDETITPARDDEGGP